ncbi:MAG: 4'-phosphopantetheinyl transferase superfamily protein [Paracoccaceae bacterium]|nr:4'-phosphopantetheinyl transferase superfamily protein [Paracoccaceae bacterium]
MRQGARWAARRDFDCTPHLVPEEATYVKGCHPKRRAEFTAGRDCANAALAALGASTGIVGIGPDRRPIWPTGYTGTITHCDGLCLAVASLSSRAQWLGSDAEPNAVLPRGVAPRVLSPDEQAAQRQSGQTDRIWFSAKECVFKALYPVVQEFFGFEHAHIEPRVGDGTFSAFLSPWLRDKVDTDRLSGHLFVSPEFIVTLIEA